MSIRINSDAVPNDAPGGPAGGDLSGTYPNPTVETSDASDALNSATTTIVVNSAVAPTNGQVLTATSGTAANWQTPSSGSPGGLSGQLQFNNGSGGFGANANVAYDTTNDTLNIGQLTSPTYNNSFKLVSKGHILFAADESNDSNCVFIFSSPNPTTQPGQAQLNIIPISNSTYGAIMIQDNAGYLFISSSDASAASSPLTVPGASTVVSSGPRPLWVASGLTGAFALFDKSVSQSGSGSVTIGCSGNTSTRLIINPGPKDGGNGYCLFNTAGDSMQVGIGNSITGVVPSAILEVDSTTQGFLPPTMTATQVTSIASPAEGLITYDLTNHALRLWDGTSWKTVTVS